MALFFLLSLFLLTLCDYSHVLTKYDDNIKIEEVENITGFLKDHEKEVQFKKIGEYNLLTYSMENNDELTRVQQVEAFLDLIDRSHPSVIALQEVTKKQIEILRNRVTPHYNIVEIDDTRTNNIITSEKTFLPIIYDTEVFDMIDSGDFKTQAPHHLPYASWITLKTRTNKKIFTAVNVNMFSMKTSIVDTEMASLLSDSTSAPLVNDNPIFILGVINSYSDKLKYMMKTKLLNTLEQSGKVSNTLNNLQDMKNNIQRDFILTINSKKNKIKVLYSAVLKRFKHGLRFPIQAIVNYVDNTEV